MFESVMELTREQVQWLNDCTKGTWALNPQTGLVDVEGRFSCSSQDLTDFKGVKFGMVDGTFYCLENQLTSLVGAPQSVGGGFDCEDNQLTTLVGAPKTVGGSFDCRGNPVSERTLEAIFALMKSGESYQQALEERWPRMTDEDRVLMYKQMPNLSPEDARKYKALATYNNIKGYL